MLNLIVIRDYKCISKSKLYKLFRNNKKLYLFASNDIYVKNLLEKEFSINTIFLDSKISSAELNKIAVNCINSLNITITNSLKKNYQLNDIPNNILLISKHIEGGDVNQRIHDIFMYDNIYKSILKKENISKLILFNGKKYFWEDKIMIKVAYDLRIKVEIYNNHIFYYMINKLYFNLKFILKLFFRIYNTFKIILFDIFSGLKLKINKGINNIILIQLCSDADKHIMVIKELGENLKKSNFQELIIGWKANNAKKYFQKQNYLNLESLLSIKDILKSFFLSLIIYKSILINIKNELKNSEKSNYNINSIDLFNILRSHCFCDLSDRIRNYFAMLKLSKMYTPSAIRPWTRILYEAVILYEVYKSDKSIKYFWQPSTDYFFDGPKIDYHVPADIIFACSLGHKEKLITMGINHDKIFLVGNPWNSRINKFLSQFDRKFSLNLYNINNKYKFIVFFDPSYVCVHYSIIEQLDALYTLLNICSIYKELCLIIKPHIGYKGVYLEQIVKNMNLKNVIFISKYDSPFHALNCSDIIITKFSNLVLEAMLFKKPTICLLFDKNDQYKLYDNNCEYIYTKESLKIFFINIFKDINFYNNWRDKLINSHKLFLERHLNIKESDSNEVIVKYLHKLVC